MVGYRSFLLGSYLSDELESYSMFTDLYQLVLNKLRLLPEAYLTQVDAFLNTLQKKVDNKEQNRQQILALAGGWEGFTEDEVQEIRAEGRRSSEDLFGREVDW